jgi:hypothetical protein
MKKLVFYPILFSINPILLLYSVNINNISPTQLSPGIFISALVALLLLFLVNLIIKDIHRAGFIVFILALWFYYYMTFQGWVSNVHIGSISIGLHWITLAIWSSVLSFMISKWFWRRITQPEYITLYLNLVCIVLVTFSIIRISMDLVPMYFYKQAVNNETQSTIQANNVTIKPDIYYIILDGYARADVLQELYNFDNSTLITELKNRGFFIASQSQSNYIQTALSLASSLNMQYFNINKTTHLKKGLIIGSLHESQSRELLEQLGYKYVAFSSGYPPTDITNANIYYSFPKIERAHDLEALLLFNSILGPFIGTNWVKIPITRFSTPQKRIDNIFNSLKNEVPLINGPKFVFAYIFAPHPPSIFNQNGPITPEAPFRMEGAFDYEGTFEQYGIGYVQELSYVNRRLIETVDGIISNSKIPPIIILQADHGPDAFLDWNSIENSCLKERFSILNAYYLPPKSSVQITEDINPINTFAVVLNAYFGTNITLLENRQFFGSWDNQSQFKDVSNISQTCNLH